jgi:carrier protein
VQYIKSVDGFFGCYRGLLPRLCQAIVSKSVHRRVALQNPFLEDGGDGQRRDSGQESLRLSKTRSGALIRGSQVAEDFETMARHTGWEILSVTASTLASQPFFVISVRSMAQFVGRETKYRYKSRGRRLFNYDGRKFGDTDG